MNTFNTFYWLQYCIFITYCFSFISIQSSEQRKLINLVADMISKKGAPNSFKDYFKHKREQISQKEMYDAIILAIDFSRLDIISTLLGYRILIDISSPYSGKLSIDEYTKHSKLISDTNKEKIQDLLRLYHPLNPSQTFKEEEKEKEEKQFTRTEHKI